MFDILIIGAGPSGSNLARLLGNAKNLNYKVGLLDKRKLDSAVDSLRQKACGGLLAPDAQKMMAELGLSLPADVLESPQLFKVRTIDLDRGYERDYQRYYYNMNREKFDRYLFSLIPNNVDIRTGVIVKSIVPRVDRWVVSYLQNGATKTVEATFLVAADGANSLVRNQILPEYQMPKKYISVQQWFNIDCHMPYYTGIFDSSITDYYSWTIQKSNQLILGSALPYDPSNPSKVMEKFETLKCKVSSALNLDFGEQVKTESAFINRTTSLKALRFGAQIKMKHGNVLGLALIGEAAGATSPTSAEGFSYALKTSLKLFGALEKGLENAELRYDLSCDSIRLNLLMKQIKSPGMYAPRLRNLVMRSGIGALTPPYKASGRTCVQSPSFHTASSHER